MSAPAPTRRGLRLPTARADDSDPRAGPEHAPLEGWTVAVTGARRSDELTALLEQRAARVLHLPALRIVSLQDDRALLDATQACLREPIDIVVATTGIGFRAWLEAADAWGVGDELRDRLLGAQVFARGPKASGAVTAAGLADRSAPCCTSTWEILDRLLATGVSGRRVVVQLHGGPLPDLTSALRTAGAHVIELRVYRTAPPDDPAALERLLEHVCARDVHAVTFTSAAAAMNVLDTAVRLDVLDEMLRGFEDVIAVCVGSVSAAPWDRLAVPTVLARQPRLGELARAVAVALERRAINLAVAGHALEVRGFGTVVDGRFRTLQPAPMALLRQLAASPGHVMSPTQLLQGLPGAHSDEHAVEMAVRRLRTGLGDAGCVQNVVKRGYRLACGPVVPSHAEASVLVDDRGCPQADRTEPLLDEVGGPPVIREAVDRLYVRLLAHPRLSAFFEGVDMPRLKRHQVLLLSQLLGGPAQYGGRELAEAHAGLGITAEDYHQVTTDLVDVLVELRAPEGVVAAVAGALDALQESIAPVTAP